MRKDQSNGPSSTSNARGNGNNLRMFMQSPSLSQYRANDCQPPGARINTQQSAAVVAEPKTELEKDVFNFLM